MSMRHINPHASDFNLRASVVEYLDATNLTAEDYFDVNQVDLELDALVEYWAEQPLLTLEEHNARHLDGDADADWYAAGKPKLPPLNRAAFTPLEAAAIAAVAIAKAKAGARSAAHEAASTCEEEAHDFA